MDRYTDTLMNSSGLFDCLNAVGTMYMGQYRTCYREHSVNTQ